MVCGKISSIDPISLENLFKIRPDGLSLKNFMGARVTRLNIASCMLREICRHIVKKSMDRANVIITVPTFNAEKMYTFSSISFSRSSVHVEFVFVKDSSLADLN